MHETFPGIVIGVTDPRSRLTNEVLGRILASPTFENINANADKFRLTRALNTEEDVATIKEKFERIYHIVTVTKKKSPHG